MGCGKLLRTGACLLAVMAPEMAMANDAAEMAPARQTVFEATFFTQYAPLNALDIVNRVPGFALDQGNGDLRGFSGAAGNIVINGARPSSKSEGLSAVLQRIPASRVLRVELGPGDLYGSDFAGKSQVLNVVLTDTGGLDGTLSLSARRVWTGVVVPDATLSLLYKRGNSSFSLSASGNRWRDVEEGYDHIFRLSDGVQIEQRRKINTLDERNPSLSLGWSNEAAADRAAHLSLRYQSHSFDLRQRNHVTPLGHPERDDRLTQRFRGNDYEASGDVTRPLMGGAIKLVGIASRKDSNAFDTSYNIVAGTRIGGNELAIDAVYDEALGRLSWSRSNLLGMSFEAGGELAFNRLRNATDVWAIDASGTRSRIDLPVDTATVSELRSEAYVNLGRQLTRTLRIDGSVVHESSRLKVAGDTRARRSLHFWKPGLTLDWKAGKGWHFQASLVRKVAQLDFHDFLAKAEFASGQINGGNAELRPQSSWETRLTAEHPILGKGLLKLELGQDRVSDLQDRVLTPDGFDAPGNLGTGKRHFAKLTLDAPLADLGAKSLRLRLDGTVMRSRVHDPLSGRSRPWSGTWQRWQWSADLRRDKGPWSFGITAEDHSSFAFYRIDEVDRNFNAGIFGGAFAEFRPDRRTTVKLTVDNLFDIPGNRARYFYSPDRSSPAPELLERRDRNAHVAFGISVSRTIGSSR